MDKTQLRAKFQKTLLKMSPEQRTEKSRKACQNLISTKQFQDASTVMMYLSLPHEADTHEAILCAWQLGKTVVAPKISWQQRHMIPVQINTLETGLSTEASGVRNPIKGIPIPFENIALCIAPAFKVRPPSSERATTLWPVRMWPMTVSWEVRLQSVMGRCWPGMRELPITPLYRETLPCTNSAGLASLR